MLEILTWWLVVELIGLAVWPVTWRFFRNLPDRGYAFTKPLGLLLVAYPFWLLTTFGFLSNTQGAIALVAVLVAVLAWGILGRPGAQETTSTDGHSKNQARDVVAPVAPPAPRPALPPQQPSQPTVERERRNKRKRKTEAVGTRPVLASAGPAVSGAPESYSVAPAFDGQAVQTPAPVPAVPVPPDSPVAWLNSHVTLVFVTELVFTLAFIAWVVVRAYMPEIQSTEKPMEFAFLNGILQSAHFPPQDPWLAGYAISYYYFGYIVMAMLTMLTGIPSSIAFNLAIALLFGLAGSGAFGLAYDLIAGWERRAASLRQLGFALFAPVLLLVMGNLEVLFEVLHVRGLGSPEFWNWLDIKGLAEAPVTGSWVSQDNWWWWRASRVIHDVARGQTQEVIDEFPQFSFLLGDMHPHVLALPFVLLALAVALNLLRSSEFAIGNLREAVRNRALLARLALIALVVGALPFLNFWDILPYGFIIVATFAIARYRADGGWNRGALGDLVKFAVGLGVAGLVLYLPFYVGFQSQAGGLLPVLFVKTQLHQYLIMFGAFVFIFVFFLAWLLYEQRETIAHDWFSRALPFITAVLALPLAVAGLTVILLLVSPGLQEQARAAFPDSPGNLMGNVMGAYFGPLVSDPWLSIVLAVLLVVLLVLLRTHMIDRLGADPITTFVLLLILTGFLLTFGVEFVYLRDVFGTRMNTVFKFYFQTWALFSVAGAFAIYVLSTRLNRLARGVWFAGLAVLLGIGFIYPAIGIPNRAEDMQKTPTLDGIHWIAVANPSDYAGIQWLREHAPPGSRLLESTGRQYSYDDRMSMATGLPTVLGWIGHEDQWRGGSSLFKNDAAKIDRAADVARIYQTRDANEALTLLGKYAINFVVVGQTERSQYALTQAQIDKFSKIMTLVFENGDLRIYARSQ